MSVEREGIAVSELCITGGQKLVDLKIKHMSCKQRTYKAMDPSRLP